MKKIKLLLAAMAAMVGMGVSAQTTIEMDYTSKLDITAAAWKGSSGLCATNFAPAITTKDGRTAQLAENYQSDVSATGDLMTQTVTGLPNGTYRVSIYANAFYTSGRGFSSDMEDGAEDVCYVFAGTGDNRQQQFITARIAESTTANDLRTLNDVVVTDGTLVVGLGKAKAGTNWHTVQVYEITAVVDVTELLATANANYEAVKDKNMQASASEALEAAKAAVDAEVTNATLEAFDAAITAAQNSAAAYEAADVKLAAMKELVDATNFYTTDAYNTYYGTPAAAFEAGTLTTAEANALQNPNTVTGWHASITVDNFLLSVWDVEPDFAGAYYINTWSTEGGSDGSNFNVPFFEYWTADGNSLDARTLTATISDLTPEDIYSVEIWARVRVRDGGTKTAGSITMQVGEGKTVDLTAGAQIGSFYLDHFTAVGTVDADGKLVVKINVAAESNISWLSFKNVKYTKVDDVRIPLAEQLAALVANVQSLSTTLAVPDAVKANLNTVAETYEGKEYTDLTEEEFNAAIDEVQAAVTNAQNSVAPYAAFTSLKGSAEALAAVDNDNEDANGELVAAITSAGTDAEAATTTEAINAATATLKTAMTTYVFAANPVGDDAKFDCTFLLTNPDVTSYWTGAWNVQPAGWYNEQSGGNFQVMANENMAPGGEVFMEYWSETAASNGFVLCQKVTLPEGTYQFGGRVGLQQYDGNGTTANVTFSANNQDGSQIAFGTLQDASAKFLQTSAEPVEVKVGLKAHSGNNARWMAINKIQLFKIPAEVIEISEDADYTPEAGAGKVVLTRTIKAGTWNTFVVPFAINNDDLKAAFGNDVAVAEFSENSEGNTVEVNFDVMDTPAITANTPVLLKTSTGGTSYTFNNRTVASGDVKVAGANVAFVGTYAAETTVAKGDYFIGSDQLWKSTGATTIKGTRAYISVPQDTQAGEVKMFINGITTSISLINGAAAAENGAIFNLAGQRVSKAQKGIYVVNGKKVIVK